MLHKEFNNGLRAYPIHQAVQPMGSTALIMTGPWNIITRARVQGKWVPVVFPIDVR